MHTTQKRRPLTGFTPTRDNEKEHRCAYHQILAALIAATPEVKRVSQYALYASKHEFTLQQAQISAEVPVIARGTDQAASETSSWFQQQYELQPVNKRICKIVTKKKSYLRQVMLPADLQLQSRYMKRLISSQREAPAADKGCPSVQYSVPHDLQNLCPTLSDV
eukprot:6209332-Pleurochrysis_carterae.AAC.8